MSEKEIKSYMDQLVHETKESVKTTVRWYLGFSFGVILMLGGFIGWTAKEVITVKQEVRTIQNDLGYSYNQLHGYYPDDIIFETNAKKYSQMRGGSK